MRSWHDFHIVGYEVNGRNEAISFTLEWPYETESDVRKAKLNFRGVECYYIEHDLAVNIVYSVSAIPLRPMIESWQERFEVECKYGWPKFWRPKPYPVRPVADELEDAIAALSQRDIKCFELSSSYGLSGWILASAVEHQVET